MPYRMPSTTACKMMMVKINAYWFYQGAIRKMPILRIRCFSGPLIVDTVVIRRRNCRNSETVP